MTQTTTDISNPRPYFAWVRCVTPWAEPKLYPQVIHDVSMHDYIIKQAQVTHNRHFEIVAKHVLPDDEVKLSITELIKRYPSPGHSYAQS